MCPAEPLIRRVIGTTGNPKGCLITHEGLVEAIWAISRIATIAPFEEGEDAWEGRYLATACTYRDGRQVRNVAEIDV